MNENNTIKELVGQAKNTHYLVNEVVAAAYGADMDEIMKQAGKVRVDNPEVAEIARVLDEREDIKEMMKAFMSLNEQQREKFMEWFNEWIKERADHD
ncbi:MAG: hypothetical protein LIO81_07920 [Clostridiales bacterium]|nr:hypothetical protein [Clostridiales bacterium]